MPAARRKDELVLKIMQDPDPYNPRTAWENLTKMICWHRKYTLGDKHNFPSPKELSQYLANTKIIHQPLYMMDHSGLTINMQGFAEWDPQGWDWGRIGSILLTDEELGKELDRLGKKERQEKALSIFDSEIRVYNYYLQGEVYGYQIIRRCPTCGREDETEDSGWGFYGNDLKENGIYDCLPVEFKDRIDAGEEFFCENNY
jgi:hypothetical protein